MPSATDTVHLNKDGSPDKRYGKRAAGVLHPDMIAQQNGRPKGATNKIERDTKQMIERALELAKGEDGKKGGVAYLLKQSEKNAPAFMALVGKILPKQIDIGVSVQAVDLMGVMQQRRTELAARHKLELGDVIDATVNEDD